MNWLFVALTQHKIQFKNSTTINGPRRNEITSLLPNPDSIYLGEASDYLGISKENLIKIIDDSNSGIPYLKTNSKTYIFNKKALDKWLETSYIIP